MGKKITITYNERQYTLEYTRKTVAQMERGGFRVDEVMSKPMTSLPALFAGAFLAHHPGVPSETVNKIYASLPNKEGLIEALTTLYNEPILTLLEEPTEGAVGNAAWEMG